MGSRILMNSHFSGNLCVPPYHIDDIPVYWSDSDRCSHCFRYWYAICEQITFYSHFPGISIMITYYLFFHPNRRQLQVSQSQTDLTEVEKSVTTAVPRKINSGGCVEIPKESEVTMITEASSEVTEALNQVTDSLIVDECQNWCRNLKRVRYDGSNNLFMFLFSEWSTNKWLP